MKKKVILNLKKSMFLLITCISLVSLICGCSHINNKQKYTLSGTIEANTVDVASEVAGKIVKINKNEGDSIKKDDVLFELDSSAQSLIVQQQEAVLRMKEERINQLKENSRPDTEIKQAEADRDATKAQLDQAKLALSKFKVKANSDGVYQLRIANLGDIINAGSKVATISDPNNMEVKLFIQQKYLNKIELNDEISLQCSALSGANIKGKIIYIADRAEYTPQNIETNLAKENTVFEVRVKILDNLDKIRTGMTVETVIQ
ncbi:HlyD family secretion protein [Ruminiclostridium josui]|uniref:HlyD family secretion protein n=1 Tax=Ruminiclostridium josui TaxID=1499 RepID=UPI0004663B45|nr:efflux RND transporter periplasmic adaptor subunit [Ruminiclostridium josui]